MKLNDPKHCLAFFRTIKLIVAFMLLFKVTFAIEEPYINELKGADVATGNFFTVADEKFGDATAWSSIYQTYSVNNIISFEINFDTTIYFYNQPFSATVNFKIYIYGNSSDTSEVTDSIMHSNVGLEVKYDTVTGKAYKGIALYKFKNAHKFKVLILDVTSAELDPIPAIFRLKGQIIVDRQYNFVDNSTDTTRFSIINTNQLLLQWTPSRYPGAQSFDVEYTHIDDSSQIAESIRTYLENTGSTLYASPVDSLAKWFRNNNTRINTAASSYLIDVPYRKGYILFRIRGTLINRADGLKWEGNWNYAAIWASDDCPSGCPEVAHIEDHEPDLNWQYSIVFAEEGKRKSVMSYFDGALHSRQSVTINNSDNRTIVQESIYDVLGRPAINILPVPALDSTIHYFRNFNRNLTGDPYSFSDFSTTLACETNAQPMSIASGASQYYSENNPFLNDFYYAKYIPKADSFPFAVTEYIADNTGRISMQGGVGPKFQINSGHETKYFYGKPSQTELDRLFGVEAGNATHYLKNMVIDANGQISVSYVGPGGQTVATALAGEVPSNMHALPSSAGASTEVTDNLISPESFSSDASNYNLSANATFLAPVTGTYVLNYKVDPLKLEILHGPDKDSVICSTCYYDLEIIVKDNCDNLINYKTIPAGNVFDTSCSFSNLISDTLHAEIEKVGAYYVSYHLRVSKDALDYFDSVHLEENSDIRIYNSFLLDELKNTDFTGCFNDCRTCLDDLGTQQDFVDRFKTLYTTDSLAFTINDSLYALTLYDSLLAHCQSIQGGCSQQNVCHEKLELLKMDVSPGGQYALYDSTYTLQDIPTNVLAIRNSISYFPDGLGGRDSVMLYTEAGEDSLLVDVKDLPDSLFIANWKDGWADSLVRLHPEYCYYLWCLANSDSYEFDREIEDWTDADSAIAKEWFDPEDYKALLDKDPFFNTFSSVVGKGVPMYERMKDSLRLFSRTVVKMSQSDKNILEFIDIALYCKTQYNGWDACDPDDACRSRSREWFMYKQFYLNLKQRFYEEARRGDSVFNSCTNCYIGNDPLENLKTICPVIEGFEFSDFITGEVNLEDENDIPYRPDTAFIKYIAGPNIRKTVTVNFGYVPGCPTAPEMNWNTVFHAGDSIGSVAFRNYNPECAIILKDIICADSVYLSFTDSTCNYSCPGGIYSPYDRDSLSFYIEYGNPSSQPSGTPTGYGQCRFYPVFDLKTDSAASCIFFNVWVCIYDSTCTGGICPPDSTSFPSHCADDSIAVYYKNKVRRYPEYIDGSTFLDQALSGNPQQQSESSNQQILDECRLNCEAQADYWISVLSRCTTDENELAQLKEALIDVCSSGCSVTNPFGTSTIPSSVTATYHSFEEAIEGILGSGAINDSCTAELLSSPYPYDKQPVYVERVIFETNYEICQKITSYMNQWVSSGYVGSFHAYLKEKLGRAYELDSLELDDLVMSCTQCNGILKNDIVLPVAFEPGSAPCVSCADIELALTDFNTKFPDLDTLNPDYEILFANFFNHRFGFSLLYSDYQDFLDNCEGSSSILLCNRAMQEEYASDPAGSCMSGLFATAMTNAQLIYIAYIDSVRIEFRNAYMTKCMNVQPALTMSAELYEYHYTLYYYDQSGSLVKTIPPEGVTLLDEEELADVKLFRLLQNEGCYHYSDSVKFNNNGYALFPSINYDPNQAFTLEARINLHAHDDQVVFSQFEETATGQTTPDHVYRGYIVSIDNNHIKIDLHSYVHQILLGYFPRSATAVSVLPADVLLPEGSWRHLALKYSGNPLNPWQLIINGNEVALQYSSNDLTAVSNVAGTDFIIGSHGAEDIALPGNLRGTIKNLRIYDRLLAIGEIRQNAFNNCQTPASQSQLVFWAPLNTAHDDNINELIAHQDGTLNGFSWEPFVGVFNDHRLVTTYQYNSLNQVVHQYSPDGDATEFFYDRLGRLTASQNMEQKTNASYSGPANRFSYTKYDLLGRISEVGEKSGEELTDIREVDMLDSTAVKSWLLEGEDKQVTKTIYSEVVSYLQSTGASRNRVTASIYLEEAADAEGDSTVYSYDISGNVKTLLQHVKTLVAVDIDNGKKIIDYDYDLVSGKVNTVSYQPGKGDQFFYKYLYDADNRVVRSLTSRDQLIWTEEASYSYYLHGPLARTELGHWKVQGIDYAYTLQGWLKGINSDSLNVELDMAGDGRSGTTFSRVSRDVYSFKLGYFNGDYDAAGHDNAPAFGANTYTLPGSFAATGNELFNGNVSYTSLALSKINDGRTAGYSYGYDQLNRLVEMRQHAVSGGWSNSDIIDAYSESVAYDANGNILKYLRRGADVSGSPLEMDSLTYKYNWDEEGRLVNNRLNHVRDAVNGSNYDVDIDNQEADNYSYDRVGNLIHDETEALEQVRWTVYGKINRITKGSGTTINYGYDPGGNRTSKSLAVNDTVTTTWYLRDAQGNVMAVYSKKAEENMVWNEQHLYGSSRLGMWKWDTIIPAAAPVVGEADYIYDSLMLGGRAYELSNHLGNVLATISDKKIGNDSSGVVNFYLAEVLTQNDYFPFGMLMPERRYSVKNYRYGFNGKENDNEVKGEGNQQDYGERIYDPRIGRLLSIDPIRKKFPFYTPYNFAANKPIWCIDYLGLQDLPATNPANKNIMSKDQIYQAALKTIHYKEAIRRNENVVLRVNYEVIPDGVSINDIGAREQYSYTLNLNNAALNPPATRSAATTIINISGQYFADGRPAVRETMHMTFGYEPGYRFGQTVTSTPEMNPVVTTPIVAPFDINEATMPASSVATVNAFISAIPPEAIDIRATVSTTHEKGVTNIAGSFETSDELANARGKTIENLFRDAGKAITINDPLYGRRFEVSVSYTLKKLTLTGYRVTTQPVKQQLNRNGTPEGPILNNGTATDRVVPISPPTGTTWNN